MMPNGGGGNNFTSLYDNCGIFDVHTIKWKREKNNTI